MKGERSRVFGSGNWARGYKNGRREGERCFRLADTKVCQGHSEVPGIGELLSLIHSGLCIHSKTIAQHGEKGSEVGMDGKVRRGV